MVPKIYFSWESLLPKLSKYLYDKGTTSTSQTWQGTKGRTMLELLNICFTIQRPNLLPLLKPNLPWANEHFKERVSGIPYNPPPSHKLWPFQSNDNSEFIKEEKFSHTYPERFWPKYAGVWHLGLKGYDVKLGNEDYPINSGIAFDYGDLQDVINLIKGDIHTRQAYLPIWFPEDTGVVEGQRVPCSIGYHFQIRHGYLHCHYTLRSCDFLLHFMDDMYMAQELMSYIVNEAGIQDLSIGPLTVSIDNLHCFIEGKEIIKQKWSKLWNE